MGCQRKYFGYGIYMYVLPLQTVLQTSKSHRISRSVHEKCAMNKQLISNVKKRLIKILMPHSKIGKVVQKMIYLNISKLVRCISRAWDQRHDGEQSCFLLGFAIDREAQSSSHLYLWHDDLNFYITPLLSGNIQFFAVYGVFLFQLIRYARNCISFECFILVTMLHVLFNRLLGQGFFMERLNHLRTYFGQTIWSLPVPNVT